MPECHKCPYNGTNNPICLKCQGPAEEPNHRGQTHISMDAGGRSRKGDTLGTVQASLRGIGAPEPAVPERPEMDVARMVLHDFLDMDRDDLALVRALMRGESMSAYSRRAGMTRAAVSWRVKKIVKAYPAFHFLRGRV